LEEWALISAIRMGRASKSDGSFTSLRGGQVGKVSSTRRGEAEIAM